MSLDFQYVVNRMGNSIQCPDCYGEMFLQTTNGKTFYSCSRWPYCNGSHGAHPDGRPLGIPATKETKQQRIIAHAALSAYQQLLGITKNGTYKRFAKLMGMTRKECHIGRFDSNTCRRAITLLNNEAYKISGTLLPGFKAEGVEGAFVFRSRESSESG